MTLPINVVRAFVPLQTANFMPKYIQRALNPMTTPALPPLITPTKLAEVRVNKLAANIVGMLFTILLCSLSVWLGRLLPHHATSAGWHAITFLMALLLLLPVHEGLHAIGLRKIANVPWSHIRFGFMWQALMPYCHCTVPIPVKAYRQMALLPLWGTGSASLLFLLAFPSDFSGLFAGLAIAACVGDVWMVLKLKRFAAHLLVQDSPTEIGCDVLASHVICSAPG